MYCGTTHLELDVDLGFYTDSYGSVLSRLSPTKQICLEDPRREITWKLEVRPERADTYAPSASAECQTLREASHGRPQQIVAFGLESGCVNTPTRPCLCRSSRSFTEVLRGLSNIPKFQS